MTRSEFLHEAAMEAIESEDVLDARIVSADTNDSSSENNFLLISRFTLPSAILTTISSRNSFVKVPFGPTTFVRSNEHALAGKTNINTRRFLAQQAFIELTSDSAEWLSKKFDLRLSERGKISSSFIRALGRPEKEI